MSTVIIDGKKIEATVTIVTKPEPKPEPKPDVAQLVEALERFIEWYEPLRLGDEPAFQFYDMSKKALAKYNEMMGEGNE